MLDATNHAHLPPSPWTEEKTARLREMHAAGKRYPIIGAALGFTRNAIAGKVLRLGLDKRARPKTRPRTARIGKTRADSDRGVTQRIAQKLRIRSEANGGAQIVECVVRDELPQPAEFLGVTFADLADEHCRFPRGEGASIVFCGQPRLAGKPYCGFCCSLAYNYPLTAASTARAYTADAQRRAFGT